MKVAVIGASGVIGRVTVPVLLAQGFSVRAVNPSPGQPMEAIDGELELTTGNILDSDDMLRAVSGCDIAVHVATSVPKPGPVRDWSTNDAIRRQGTVNLLQACAKHKVKHYVQQSVAMLYDAGGDGWLDETSPIRPTEALKSAVDMEMHVRDSEVPWTILRGGTLYGPSTGREGGWLQQARDGSLRLPSDGTDFASLVHQDDLAAAMAAACIKRPRNCILNVVDDEPVRWRELYGFVAERAGTAQPQENGPVVYPSQRVSNRRAKAALEWRPGYPSYREGLQRLGQ